MTDTRGFEAIGKRIEQLLEETGGVSPADMMMLLMQAETNPGFDLLKELERLRSRQGDTPS
jgi:hypothetical protein